MHVPHTHTHAHTLDAVTEALIKTTGNFKSYSY